MMKRTRLLTATATVLLLPTLLTACSSRPSDDTAPTSKSALDDNAAKLVQCMRDRGYDMPDQQSGMLQVGPPDGADFDSWKADFDACSAKHPAPGADEGKLAKPDPEAQRQYAKYAKCMRDEGITDFPDDMDAKYEPSDERAMAAANETCMSEYGVGGAALPAG